MVLGGRDPLPSSFHFLFIFRICFSAETTHAAASLLLLAFIIIAISYILFDPESNAKDDEQDYYLLFTGH